MKQGPWFSYKLKTITSSTTTATTSDIHVATALWIFQRGESGWFGSGHDPKKLFEKGLVAGDSEWSMVTEPVLLLRLHQKLLEDRVVQVTGADHEPPLVGSHANRHVSSGYIGWRHSCLRSPPEEHLPEPHNSPDFAALPGRRRWRHFRSEERERFVWVWKKEQSRIVVFVCWSKRRWARVCIYGSGEDKMPLGFEIITRLCLLPLS